jgi:ApaG protein
MTGDQENTYRAITHDIAVSVVPRFLAEHSEPDESRYFWSYTVVIENLGGRAVQLRRRHWRITDGSGRMQEVRGAGVIGEEPVIQPGGRFVYTSGCPLETPDGFMVGSYEMEAPDGQRFFIDIPAFSLDSPAVPRTLN